MFNERLEHFIAYIEWCSVNNLGDICSAHALNTLQHIELCSPTLQSAFKCSECGNILNKSLNNSVQISFQRTGIPPIDDFWCVLQNI